MAVTRADKTTELESLEGAFKGHDVAILIDYKGINVPQVTQLRTELRKAKASYKVVKNSLAKRALKGTAFEPLSAHFEGMTAVAYTKDDPVALAKALTTFMKNAPTLQIKAAVVQGQATQGRRSCGAGDDARQAGALREAALPPPGADGEPGARAERGAEGLDERARAGGEEAEAESLGS